jgi:hypothetical protein
VHPLDGDEALRELERVVAAGARWLKLHPYTQGFGRSRSRGRRDADEGDRGAARIGCVLLAAQRAARSLGRRGRHVLRWDGVGSLEPGHHADLVVIDRDALRVVTIEYDGDLAAQAANLRRAGYPAVQVITGDGALGYQPAAPYERIIVTAEATDITAAWWSQLTPDGRIVVPVRLHGSGLTRAIGLRRTARTP